MDCHGFGPDQVHQPEFPAQHGRLIYVSSVFPLVVGCLHCPMVVAMVVVVLEEHGHHSGTVGSISSLEQGGKKGLMHS